MTSEIDKLKHFDALNYKGEYFTNELEDGEEFLYSTIKIQDDSKVMKRSFNRFRTTKNTEAIVFENGGFVGNLGLVKKTMEEIY